MLSGRYTDATKKILHENERPVLPRPEPATDDVIDQRDLDDVQAVTVFENLKAEINAFLWQRLPGRTPLARADVLSNQIFELFEKEWNRC